MQVELREEKRFVKFEQEKIKTPCVAVPGRGAALLRRQNFTEFSKISHTICIGERKFFVKFDQEQTTNFANIFKISVMIWVLSGFSQTNSN
jgi:hypothetical protein